jgi:hypothetical protein
MVTRNQNLGVFMRGRKIIFTTLAAFALLAASISSADARGFRHRGPGPVLGLLGGVIVGAATIATLPFALLAEAANAGPPPRGYYEQGAYGPPQGGYGYGPPPSPGYGYGYSSAPPPPPPRYSRGYDGPSPGNYGYGNGY